MRAIITANLRRRIGVLARDGETVLAWVEPGDGIRLAGTLASEKATHPRLLEASRAFEPGEVVSIEVATDRLF